MLRNVKLNPSINLQLMKQLLHVLNVEDTQLVFMVWRETVDGTATDRYNLNLIRANYR